MFKKKILLVSLYVHVYFEVFSKIWGNCNEMKGSQLNNWYKYIGPNNLSLYSLHSKINHLLCSVILNINFCRIKLIHLEVIWSIKFKVNFLRILVQKEIIILVLNQSHTFKFRIRLFSNSLYKIFKLEDICLKCQAKDEHFRKNLSDLCVIFCVCESRYVSNLKL